ncbi:peptidyl-tRNA hydrolase [Euryarchaeota archaeon SM23-78]|nr:MAG: peptidyl-tRNA hydrolase [Euryarchaeota archaeon SM23-78]MBW3001483.1 peptidyl-tRNA hydrolase Pth2 [Candidatus Woesearchaeota archaeon]
MNYKQAILVRQDLKLPKGKIAVQCSHASIESMMNAKKTLVNKWLKEGMGKVVLKVKNVTELKKYVSKANKLGISTAMIRDAGHTVVKPGTITCAGLGPNETKKIDKIVSKLKLV